MARLLFTTIKVVAKHYAHHEQPPQVDWVTCSERLSQFQGSLSGFRDPVSFELGRWVGQNAPRLSHHAETPNVGRHWVQLM